MSPKHRWEACIMTVLGRMLDIFKAFLWDKKQSFFMNAVASLCLIEFIAMSPIVLSSLCIASACKKFTREI